MAKRICALSDHRKKKQRWSIGPKSGVALPGLIFQADITYGKPTGSLGFSICMTAIIAIFTAAVRGA